MFGAINGISGAVWTAASSVTGAATSATTRTRVSQPAAQDFAITKVRFTKNSPQEVASDLTKTKADYVGGGNFSFTMVGNQLVVTVADFFGTSTLNYSSQKVGNEIIFDLAKKDIATWHAPFVGLALTKISDIIIQSGGTIDA